MISTIFFDFDGVLTMHNSGSYTTCMYIQSQYPHLKFEEILRVYRIYHPDMLIGKKTHREILKEFCSRISVPYNEMLFTNAFSSTPINQSLVDLLNELKASFNLGLITDNSSERLHVIGRKLNIQNLFDTIVVSGSIGSRKDTSFIFEEAMNRLNSLAVQCVFIDNSKENLSVADSLGMNTILYKSWEDDIDLLKTKLMELLK